MNDFDEELTRQLRGRSQDVGGHPIGMEQVRRTARRIVWRRRIATGAVAAAVVAVAVPATFAATGGVNRGIGPVGPSPSVTQLSPSPTPTPSPAPTPAPSPTPGTTPNTDPSPGLPDGAVALTTVGIPQGAAPGIIYLQGDTLHNGGNTEQLPGSYIDITDYHGGWLALDHQGRLVQLDATNHVVGAPEPSGDDFAVDGAGRTAWFVAGAPGQPGQLVQGIGMAEGQSSVPIPPGETVRPVGYVADKLVYEIDGGHPHVYLTDFTPGTAPQALPDVIGAGATSVSTNRISVLTKVTDFGSCSAVVDPAGNADWHTCHNQLGGFSPNGDYLWGYPAYYDGLGPTSVTILDARDGTPVAEFQQAPGSDLTVWDVAWEDDTHLLATVYENGSWQIVRMDTSGHLEAATPAVPGRDTDPPFHFAATP